MSHRLLLLGHCTEKIHFPPFSFLFSCPNVKSSKGSFFASERKSDKGSKFGCFFFQIIRGDMFLLLSAPLESGEIDVCPSA